MSSVDLGCEMVYPPESLVIFEATQEVGSLRRFCLSPPVTAHLFCGVCRAIRLCLHNLTLRTHCRNWSSLRPPRRRASSLCLSPPVTAHLFTASHSTFARREELCLSPRLASMPDLCLLPSDPHLLRWNPRSALTTASRSSSWRCARSKSRVKRASRCGAWTSSPENLAPALGL